MSHLVIARKFRPQSFEEVSGQVHVTKTLANAIKRNKVAHALCFAGPRGVGKTSLARIFAKALNCEKGPTSEPCGTCSNCKAITAGNSLAVREIDGASHNSVDNVRDLIDTFRALPPPGWKYKVYIIDEVHMLSVSAFNALLKSLEEPPPNTVFILATTEVHKIPETVLSRCQRHDFRELPLAQIEQRLAQILASEKQAYDPEVLPAISRAADGSMRDAQTLLERAIAYSEGKITASEIADILGLVERPALIALARSVVERNATAVIRKVADIFSAGIDPQMLCKEFAAVLREGMLLYFCSSKAEEQALDITDADALREMLGSKKMQEFVPLYDMIRDGLEACLRSSFARASFEALLVRATLAGSSVVGGTATAKVANGTTTTSSIPTAANAAPDASKPTPIASPTRVAPSSGPVHTMQSGSNAATAILPDELKASISWPAFILDASERGAPLLVEHLRRITPQEFILEGNGIGALRASGPDFNVTALLSEIGKRKLEELLLKYSGIQKWRVELKRSENTSGSLATQEKEDRQKQKQTREQSLSSHAAIEQIKKLFPGSTIESIKTSIGN